MPGLTVVSTYERAWLPKDVVAGLVLSALLVPQGMAYAELAGLPPVTGLYTSILCLIGYSIFGPSRILVLGPDSSLGPMIAATIAPLALADGDPARAVALASVLAIMVGLVMVIAGVAHMGFIADLLSKPTQIGYMNGLALTIVVGQLPKLMGFSVDADGLFDEAKAFVSGMLDGDANTMAAVDRHRFAGRDPVAVTAGAEDPGRPRGRRPRVAGGQRRGTCRIEASSTIGVLPQGFPPFTIPSVHWSDVSTPVPRRDRHRGRRAWPTRCPRPPRSPAGVAIGCTVTRRWWASVRPTSPPACSRASR